MTTNLSISDTQSHNDYEQWDNQESETLVHKPRTPKGYETLNGIPKEPYSVPVGYILIPQELYSRLKEMETKLDQLLELKKSKPEVEIPLIPQTSVTENYYSSSSSEGGIKPHRTRRPCRECGRIWPCKTLTCVAWIKLYKKKANKYCAWFPNQETLAQACCEENGAWRRVGMKHKPQCPIYKIHKNCQKCQFRV